MHFFVCRVAAVTLYQVNKGWPQLCGLQRLFKIYLRAVERREPYIGLEYAGLSYGG